MWWTAQRLFSLLEQLPFSPDETHWPHFSSLTQPLEIFYKHLLSTNSQPRIRIQGWTKTKPLPCGEHGLVTQKDVNPVIVVTENSNCEEEECIAMAESLCQGDSVWLWLLSWGNLWRGKEKAFKGKNSECRCLVSGGSMASSRAFKEG